MATVNKDFRIKHGIVVESGEVKLDGSTSGQTLLKPSATASGTLTLPAATGTVAITSDIPTTEGIQDLTAAMFTGGTHGDITFTYDDDNGLINATVSNTPTFDDKIVFEGATADDYETTLQVTEPTADRTITLPNASGTVALTSDIPSLTGYVTESGTQTLTNKTLTSPIVDGNGVVFEGTTADEFETTLTVADPTADRTITLPNVTGTVITSGDTGTVTNTMLAGSIANEKLTNSSITINGTSTSLGGTRTLVTDDISEDGSPVNLWFTDERAQDAAASMITSGTHTNLSVTYDDNAGTLSFNATGGVASLTGTANEVEVTNVGTAYTVGLPNDITVAGNITINGTPTQSTHAVTKGYVDSVAEGLHVHAAVKAATTAALSGTVTYDNGTSGVGATLTLGTALTTLDGYTLQNGNRILVKNQATAAHNGIYTWATGGTVLTRATDYDTAAEIDAGDFFFVENGTAYADSGFVQTETITTIGTDAVSFTQFSGAGTYLAGTGLQLTGNTFSIDSTVTTNSGTQTLTNKTLTSPVVSGLYLSDNNIIVEGTDDVHETTLTFTDPTGDRAITFKDESGTVAYTSDITSAINALSTTDIEEGTNLYYTAERVQDEINDTLTAGSGIGLTYTDNGASDGTLSIANTGVLSITGTSNQVTASASTGAVTLSLPQNIHSTATPTFSGLTLNGNLTLTDALIGTATQALTDGSATVIDSWATSAYSSAKYVVQMKKGNDIEVIEVLVTVDGFNNVYLTEYADMISNAQLGTTDADYSSGNVRLLVTASNGTTVKVHKTLIEA